MASSSKSARKAAYLFLILCCLSLVIGGGIYLYTVFGPTKVVVAKVPYGLPAGTTVLCGDAPDMQGEIAALPMQTQIELRRASELLRSGASRQAYESFKALSLVHPDLIVTLWNEVNTLFEMDSLETYEKERLNLLVGKLQGRFPDSGLSLYLDSRKTYGTGNKSSALEMARIASEKAPALYEIRLWYARLLSENGRKNEAVNESKVAVSLSAGDSPKAYEILAELYHDQGLIDSCTAVVNYGLSQYPVNANLLLLQGFLSEYRGHYDAAEKTYRQILSYYPNFEKANVAISTMGEKVAPGPGSVSMSPRERFQTAYEILEPMVDRYPENLPLREALGLAYLKARDFDRARTQFREIQTQDPEYPDIQMRLQECVASKPAAIAKSSGLADDLNRAVDSLRGKFGPSTSHDFSTMLGHYLVRYGASPKEFFKQYAIENFRPVDKNVWKEEFYENSYRHTYTVVFDSLNKFREVHVTVFDTASVETHLGLAPEIFTRLQKQNSRISGIGNSTGETECSEDVVIDAAVWETQDNFEILARFIGKPAEVRMVRFDKSILPPGMKLCDYVPYLNKY